MNVTVLKGGHVPCSFLVTTINVLPDNPKMLVAQVEVLPPGRQRSNDFSPAMSDECVERSDFKK